MFVYHDKYLAMLTPEMQVEVNGRPFKDIEIERINAVKEQCGSCRGCGARIGYLEGYCDGMLTPKEREWISKKIDLEKAAGRPAAEFVK
ncbi:MAG: hypothetical protein LBT45_00265 [Rickettsiales bacterium]|jgi:hypothetical protein|nr:hypothetical protein [Rickettsiales bacterium]